MKLKRKLKMFIYRVLVNQFVQQSGSQWWSKYKNALSLNHQ